MSDQATDAMQQFGGVGPIHDTSSAGLVLLYANEFAQLPSVWPLDAKATTVVGSSASASLILPVHAVSRMHAELSRERGAWVLRDRQSTNGTFLDGYRVREARLEHGQEIRIGDAILKFIK